MDLAATSSGRLEHCPVGEAIARRLTMSKVIVLQDYNMLGCIVDYLPPRGCLPFVLTCRRFRACYREYLKRPLVSDHNYYCASLALIEWACALPRSPLNPDVNKIDRDVNRLVCLGTLASGDPATFAVAFKGLTGESNPYHAEHKIIYSDQRDQMLCVAAAYGRVDMLEHLRQIGIWLNPPPPATLVAAAVKGHVRVIEYLLALSPPCVITSKTLYEVARAGRLEVLKYLREKNKTCHWLNNTTLEAALGGHLDVLRWMAELTQPPLPLWRVEIVTRVARYPQLNHVLSWLLQQPHVVVMESAAASAIYGKNLLGLKQLREHDPPCPLTWKKLADLAISSESIEMLQYLKDEGYFDQRGHEGRRYCNSAARVGLPVMQWLRAQTPPCPWFASTLAVAAECGNVPVLEWAHAQGCPWGRNVCFKAVQFNQLAVLRWLRAGDHPCPWASECCDQASINGNIEMMEYLRVEANPPCPWNVDHTVFFAIESYNMDMLKWLCRQDQPLINLAIVLNIENFLLSRRQYLIQANGYALKAEFKVILQFLASENFLPVPFSDDTFTTILNDPDDNMAVFVDWVKENVHDLHDKLVRWMYYW